MVVDRNSFHGSLVSIKRSKQPARIYRSKSTRKPVKGIWPLTSKRLPTAVNVQAGSITIRVGGSKPSSNHLKYFPFLAV